MTTTDPFQGLLFSWTLALRADNKSPKTLEGYKDSVTQYADWLHHNGHTDTLENITAPLIRGWLAQLGEERAESTVRTRYNGMRQFVSWLLAEEELAKDPMGNVSQPAVHEKPAGMLTPEQVKQVLADCDGPAFADVRDKALTLLFADTGMRLGAVAGMRLEDLDLTERVVSVTTKGSRELVIPFGANAARALDKYLRARRRQRYSDRPWLWLSSTGKGKLTPNGIQQMYRRRGTRLGFHVHPHMFRHTFADAWLAAGGGETDLMEIAGWKSRQMVGRYAAGRRAVRAREAHRRLSPMDNLT